MKQFLSLWLFLSCSLHRALSVDSVVVFSEIHYHPATNEVATEWIELHNQMAIDIDLSAWFLEDSIDYTFTEGTIIPGGGYLVVASDPVTLRAATGATNIVGPFIGRLNNSDARIELRDRNDRLMDRVEYRDRGKWPVAPDGSGATLAKRDPNTTSGSPENWTSSVVLGGTPGRRNFPEATPPQDYSLIPFDALWRFEAPEPTWARPGGNRVSMTTPGPAGTARRSFRIGLSTATQRRSAAPTARSLAPPRRRIETAQAAEHWLFGARPCKTCKCLAVADSMAPPREPSVCG